MRNHKLVHEVVEKMLEYNHILYIEDINSLIESRQFNNNINYNLNHIVNILIRLSSQNQNMVHIRPSLKTYIHVILDNEGGEECCNKLMCTNQR